jgi:hypothetical protein
MPNHKVGDLTTPGRYAQVNWRRDEHEPGYVQVSTHDATSPAAELIGAAIGIISNVDAPEAGWPRQTAEWRQAARAWLDKATDPNLMGVYTHLDEAGIGRLIKTLHKAKRQAFGEVPDKPPAGAKHRNGCTGCDHAEETFPPCWTDVEVSAEYERVRGLVTGDWRVIGDDQVGGALGVGQPG